MSSPSERSALNATSSVEKKFYFLSDTPTVSRQNSTIKSDKQRQYSSDGKELELIAPSSSSSKGVHIGGGYHNSAGSLESLGSTGEAGNAITQPSNWFHDVESNISGWVQNLFGRRSDHAYQTIGGVVGMQKPRKMPIKVEPKVFFANERTFLAWLHMSVTLASISVAIVAFAEANEWSQIYGLLLLPVAIAFCVYSLWMYIKRSNMIRRKDPGPYEDRVGPVVLATMLTFAILVNFFVKLYSMSTGKV